MYPFKISLEEYCRNNNLLRTLGEYSKQNVLPPDRIGHSARSEVLWVCKYGHEEIESPSKRLKRGYCSVCGKLHEGSFAQKYPELIDFWSEENGVSPFDIPPTYSPIVKWCCPKGHTWERRISTQIEASNICPICGSLENNLFAQKPELLDEWDYDKNTVDTHTVRAMGQTKYWWRCRNGHSFQATAAERNRRNKKCAICNSLGFLRPDIAQEWHPTLNNGKTPFDFSVNSNKDAWFICRECNHEYVSRVSVRVLRKRPYCPFCRNK